MRTAFLAFVCAASALATLHFGSSTASAGGSLYSHSRGGYSRGLVAPVGWSHAYRWYRDYAPLYARQNTPLPVVAVVPPPVSYYPPPRRVFGRYSPRGSYIYGYGRGYIYGPAGTYYPRGYRRHRYRAGW